MNHQCATTQSACLHDARRSNGVARAIAIETQQFLLSYPIGLLVLIQILSTPFFEQKMAEGQGGGRVKMEEINYLL